MKLFTGWVLSAGLVVAAGAANAQVLAPYEVGALAIQGRVRLRRPLCGDAAGSAECPAMRRATGRDCCRRTRSTRCCARAGFRRSASRVRRGFVYTISVIDRGGDDGRLVIDARTGRILRFLPANRMGDNFDDALTATYGPPGPPPPVGATRSEPRPPRAVPKVASRTPGCRFQSRAPAKRGRWPPTTPAVQPAQPAPARRSSSRPRRCRRNRPIRRPPARSPLPQPPRPSRPSPRRRSCRPRTCRRRRGWSRTSSQRHVSLTMTIKETPRVSGAFSSHPPSIISSDRPPPGSGRQLPSDATPATGVRLPAPPSSHSCAWPEIAQGPD